MRPEAPRTTDVTRLLQAWGNGDVVARDKAVGLVYDELRRLAAGYLRRERADHTLRPTALVHEAYLRLAIQDRSAWKNRQQFFAIAAHMMRRTLIDHARGADAAKRPNRGSRVALEEEHSVVQPRVCEALVLDEALTELERIDARLVRVVELRYFAGLPEQETALALGVSRATVSREWQTAKAWLFRRLGTVGKG